MAWRKRKVLECKIKVAILLTTWNVSNKPTALTDKCSKKDSKESAFVTVNQLKKPHKGQ